MFYDNKKYLLLSATLLAFSPLSAVWPFSTTSIEEKELSHSQATVDVSNVPLKKKRFWPQLFTSMATEEDVFPTMEELKDLSESVLDTDAATSQEDYKEKLLDMINATMNTISQLKANLSGEDQQILSRGNIEFEVMDNSETLKSPDGQETQLKGHSLSQTEKKTPVSHLIKKIKDLSKNREKTRSDIQALKKEITGKNTDQVRKIQKKIHSIEKTLIQQEQAIAEKKNRITSRLEDETHLLTDELLSETFPEEKIYYDNVLKKLSRLNDYINYLKSI